MRVRRQAHVVVLGLGLGLAACAHRGTARSPQPACPQTGPALIYGPEDVAALAGCARVPGLTIRTAAAVDLSPLTALVAIDGDLLIGPTLAITSLSLPAVAEVTGRIRVGGNGDLTTLFLPALRRAAAIEIVDDPALVSVSAPALTEVGGALVLARLPALELIDTRVLARVGGALTVTAAPALISWIGPPASVGGEVVIDAPRLDPEARAQIDRAP